MTPAGLAAFRDPHCPLAVRVTDLLSRLTCPEKIALLHQHQAPVARLGIGPFRTGTEALHGLAWQGPATVFPQALGLAAAWDPPLTTRVGAAVGDEVRARHHADPTACDLNVWAPVVNPLRDPRWGRNEEGYSEDSWLTGVIATAYAQGLRGDHPRYLRTAPTLKHFLGYNNETDRAVSSSNLSPRVLHEYELPPFAAPIVAGAAVAVMASYNLVNGVPAHLSPLINDELRRWTDDEILVVGDAMAVSNLATFQACQPDQVHGFAAALRAGIDSFTEHGADPRPTIALLTEALARGLISESDVDAAVRRILTVRFRLGEFDPAADNPYAAVGPETINCPEHRQLAREAARSAVVLLTRHDDRLPTGGHLLPLAADCRRLAVIGPLADEVLTDWYSGTFPYTVSAYAGLAARRGAGTTVHCSGLDRIALREAATGRYVSASDRADGGPLWTTPHQPVTAPSTGPDTWFDVFDWGSGVIALRAAANGRHVGVVLADNTVGVESVAGAARGDGVLVNDRPGPGGWVVTETFRLVPRDDSTIALHHLGTDRYVVVGSDGVLRAGTTSPGEASGFVVDVVDDGVEAAAAAASQADAAVVVLGNHPMVNGRETEDRTNLALPQAQQRLLQAVHAANPATALVLVSSYPYAITWAAEHLPAILWSAHGGQEFGHALADVVLGCTADGSPVDPGGRLTQTWYRSDADLPDLFDYDIISTDATYQYHRGEPLYPFGHGLSYTEFRCEHIRLDPDVLEADGATLVSVDVVNVGTRAGSEVVQLYTRQDSSRVKQPLKRLRGFQRVHLSPGERTTVLIPLAAADLASWDEDAPGLVVESTAHTVMVGRSSGDLPLTATLRVRGGTAPATSTPINRPH